MSAEGCRFGRGPSELKTPEGVRPFTPIGTARQIELQRAADPGEVLRNQRPRKALDPSSGMFFGGDMFLLRFGSARYVLLCRGRKVSLPFFVDEWHNLSLGISPIASYIKS